MPEQAQDRPDRCLKNLARLARVDPKLLYPLKHRGEESQAHMALIRSREALVSCRTQLVNHALGERSNPSVAGCLRARPEASTTKRPSTSPRHSGRPSGRSSKRSARSQSVSPRIRPKAGNHLQRALPRNRALAPGRGGRAAYRADLRAHLGRSPPLRKEPQRGRLFSGTCAWQGSVGRERSP